MEIYTCIAMSTAHLSDKSQRVLANTAKHRHMPGHGMVVERDTGFFIKLYEENEYNLSWINFIEDLADLADLVSWAHRAGARLIELDAGSATLQPCPLPRRD